MKRNELDSPDQVGRRDDTITVDLWYPRLEGHAKFLDVGLVDVRYAENIRISYDFDRNGYRIEKATRWMAGDEEMTDWHEVSFVSGARAAEDRSVAGQTTEKEQNDR